MTRYRPAPIANPRWYQRTYKPPQATVKLSCKEVEPPAYKQVYARPKYQYTAIVTVSGHSFTSIFSSNDDVQPAFVLTMPAVKLMCWQLTHRTTTAQQPVAA